MFEREFFDKSINKQCKLLIVKNELTEEYFFNFLIKYLLKAEKIKKPNRIVGFDIEFNTPPKSHNERVIAIFQLSFYLKSYVLIIFYNPKLVSQKTNILMKKLLVSQQVIKIGHGTDSLDVPAIYEYLETDIAKIDFTNTLYDTRFLCEFSNIITQEKLCNIYYLLEYYNVLVPEQLEWLHTNEKTLGDFWRKQIDITNLSPELRDYSMYDALYLKKLLTIMKKLFISKKYNYKLIIEVTRLVFLIKRGIILQENYSYFNIYFLKNKTKLYDNFIIVYQEFINNSEFNIKNIFAVNYFKNQLIKILQLLYYIYILNKNTVYKNKTDIVLQSDILILKEIWNKFNNILISYPEINKIIINFKHIYLMHL